MQSRIVQWTPCACHSFSTIVMSWPNLSHLYLDPLFTLNLSQIILIQITETRIISPKIILIYIFKM